MRKLVKGREWSYLLPSLLSHENTGHVHSVFKNGFNIQMNDSLIFIGNNKNGLLPFGIHLQENLEEIVSGVEVGEAVYWDHEVSSFIFPKMTLLLSEADVYRNHIIHLENDYNLLPSLERMAAYLDSIQNPTGLGIHVSKFLNKLADMNYNELNENENYIIQLIQTSLSTDRDQIEKTLRFFIGRGKGLTPSGDDLLVGLLAFHSAGNFISPEFIRQLSRLIESRVTTDVGREYLRYALKHEFSSTVTNCINSLTSSDRDFNIAFEQLLDVGHSSGLDTLFGIFIGMIIFEHKKSKISYER